MRTPLAAAALLAVAAVTPAQSPLTMPFNANNGLSTSGAIVFFDLNVLSPAGVTVTRLDVNTGNSSVGTVGTIEVYTGPTTFAGSEQNAGAWTLAVSGGVVAQGSNVPSPTCLGSGLFLPPGPHGIAVRHVGVGVRYTNGTGTNQTGATAELTLSAGASISAFFTGTYFNPRVFNGNVHYKVGNVPGSGCAQTTAFGVGCYRGVTSFYETFGSLAAFDFVGSPGTEQVLVASSLGAQGYVVTAGTPAWFTPAGSAVLTNSATPAPMGDNSMSQPLTLPFAFPFPGGSTTVVHAASDGYVNLGATTATTSDSTPTAAELLAQPARLCPLWCNLQPATNLPVNAASGVFFDVDPGNQTAYVTWRGVADRSGSIPAAGATSVDVQLALHASGAFEFRYRGIVPNTTTAPVLVGWSKGSTGSPLPVDPGSVDLSASLPLLTSGPDSRPLVHTASLPRVGTTMTLAVEDVENVVPLAVLFFGDTAVDPGVDLGFLGAPGCSGHTSANLGSATIPVSLPAGSGSVSLPIPNNPALVGLAIASQAAAFTTKNPLGIGTSNGVAWTVGN